MKRYLPNFKLCIFAFLLFFLFFIPAESVLASVSITTATGGSSISADTTGGSYTALTGPTISEGANRDFPASGTLILSSPTGFSFNTGSNVTATITRIAGSKTCFTFSSTTATPTSSTITFTITAQDSTGGSPTTTCQVVFSGIQVRPSSGTPLASGNVTHSGTAVISGITANSTSLGFLQEVAGTKTQLAITTQPSSTATVDTNFATKPSVAIRDQFGNTIFSDNTTTISRNPVLSNQSCGGTAGSGTITSTPGDSSAVSSGVLTYTAMQYSAVENIKICFTSSGLTSALSNAITIAGSVPTVTTQAASNVSSTTLTANGNITATGGSSNDIRGFVYDTSSKSLPGNVAPASSGYTSSASDTGSFGTGAYTKSLTGLTAGNTYYIRSFSHNAQGYAYGNEVSVTTVVISITISSDGTIQYGIIPANTSQNTTASGLSDTQTATNDGNVAEDFNIRGQDSANWTLGASIGSNQYTHEFSINSGSRWFLLTTSYQALASNIGATSSQNFDLRLTTPSSSSNFTQQSVDVTIQAVQH